AVGQTCRLWKRKTLRSTETVFRLSQKLRKERAVVCRRLNNYIYIEPKFKRHVRAQFYRQTKVNILPRLMMNAAHNNKYIIIAVSVLRNHLFAAQVLEVRDWHSVTQIRNSIYFNR
ncbi:MAG: hypothetical protein ACERKD_24305, partial [Prolixibacteraceae bacterium]